MAKFYDNFEGLKRAGYIMSRALLRATFCDIEDPKQRAAVDKKRRIGVGVFSYQEWCCKQGIKYSQSWKNNLIRNKLKELFQTIRVAADSYADEMGIPRPATVTTLAPTGSISNLPGGQGGAQTIFALYYYRKVRYAANDSLLDNLAARGLFIEDCVYTANTKVVRFVCEDRLVSEINSMGLNADELVEGASEVSLRDYLSIQAMFQECYVDNAISFTINTLPGQYTQKFVEETLKEFLPRLKGTTIMVDGSRAQSPFERISRREYLELTGGFGEIGSVLEECKNGSCPVR
jgi:ribonucleotide reductase alpha subunit